MNLIKKPAMNIADIRREEQSQLTNLFETLGVFFAFDTEQFNCNKKEGITYVSAGNGMVIPKDKVGDFQKGFSQIKKRIDGLYKKQINMDDYILYELNNREAFYTSDLDDSFEAIKHRYPDCTIEDVKRVYNLKRKG